MPYRILFHSTVLQHCAAIQSNGLRRIMHRLRLDFRLILNRSCNVLNATEFRHIIEGGDLLVYISYYIYWYKHNLQHRLFNK